MMKEGLGEGGYQNGRRLSHVIAIDFSHYFCFRYPLFQKKEEITMSIYDVNVQKIATILNHMESVHGALGQLIQENGTIPRDVQFYAGQRLLQLTIEGVADVGNLLIDGFIMRDPGSYQDILDIMLDEKVVTSEFRQSLGQLIEHRKALTLDYIELSPAQVAEWVRQYAEIAQQFPQVVRAYLVQELGPNWQELPSPARPKQ